VSTHSFVIALCLAAELASPRIFPVTSLIAAPASQHQCSCPSPRAAGLPVLRIHVAEPRIQTERAWLSPRPAFSGQVPRARSTGFSRLRTERAPRGRGRKRSLHCRAGSEGSVGPERRSRGAARIRIRSHASRGPVALGARDMLAAGSVQLSRNRFFILAQAEDHRDAGRGVQAGNGS